MRQLYVVAFSLVLLVLSATAMASPGNKTPGHEKVPQLDCSKCHTCKEPTPTDLCLKPCPTLTMFQESSPHGISEAPQKLVISELADLYEPVQFDHKLHAEMAEMDMQCSTCHHYSPPGRIPPCSECHGGKNPVSLSQPGLKGAYHRLCLGCHREWNHQTKCFFCHRPSKKLLTTTTIDSTDIIGISHPIITAPETKVFETSYKKAPLVTFHHKEHVELFGLKCTDCHKKEDCGYCHDLQKPASSEKSPKDVHAICSRCHKVYKTEVDERGCLMCHGHREKPAFSHASTGWPLGKFHGELDCRACHPTGKRIAKLDPTCNSCHSGWNPDNFSHVATGLQFDENHAEFDCDNCHIDRNFAAPPDCSNCHDDGRTYKEKPPGTWVKR